MTISFPGVSLRSVPSFYTLISAPYIWMPRQHGMTSLKLVQLLCSSSHGKEGVFWWWNEKRRVKRRRASVMEGEGLFVEDTGVITSAWRLAAGLAIKKMWDWRDASISTSAGSSTASFRRPCSCDINCGVRWQATVAAKLRLRDARQHLTLISLKHRLSRRPEFFYLWIP
jgi:hypothetical protein